MDNKEYLRSFSEELSEKLKLPLPGHQAHLKMSPANRKPVSQIQPNQHTKIGSVLILLFYENSNWHTVLIKRALYNGVHSGQISFPGGKKEASDTSLQQTALRETEEEIGVPKNNIEIIGNITELYIPPSRFIVYPFIGISHKHLTFLPDKKEVDKIITVSLNELFSPQNLSIKQITLSNGTTMDSPCFVVNNEIIWGATAMMLSELKEILRY